MPVRLPMPFPFNVVGKRHVELVSKWSRLWAVFVYPNAGRLPSLSVFGMSAGAGFLYFADWKLVLQYLPYYNGKFKTED